MTRILIITRGLPGSGKSTQALEWVNQEPDRRARVNRDELRMALYGKYTGLTFKQEQALSHAQRAAVKSLLEGGRSVVVDDTNLRLRYARPWADLVVFVFRLAPQPQHVRRGGVRLRSSLTFQEVLSC